MKLKASQNKWFIPFMIATVVAIAAIVVAVIMGINPEKPQNVEYTEGTEVGVYYYDVVDGEVLLTLSGGNKFTIAGPTTNKTGTYTVEGSNITLDFFKDEDGTTTATVSGDTIALLYDNATMTFRKKINYTVTFQVNGGSEVENATVVNGKTVAQPVDPVKENGLFLGWYADEACTTPFDFATTAVVADTTIYARWAERQVGTREFTVDFDLGYEGAEVLSSVTTVSGRIYGVSEPKRDGYIFGGWYISMFEDSQKLTCAYTEETIFHADTTLFALWVEEGSAKLPAPAVSVTSDTISWNAVKGATSYKVTVVDPFGNLIVDNESVAATMKAIPFADRQPGEYQISVVAVADQEANNSEAAVRYYANKALDRVSGITVVDGILIFGAVENAQRYAITIDCGDDSHVHTAFDNGASTTYYMGNCPMQEGGIRITVTAMAGGYASSTSKVFVYNKVLDRVERVEYDAKNDRFVWDAVANAADYLVTITVGDQDYVFHNGTSTSFSIAGFSGDITCGVVPVTEGYNSPESAEASCKKTAPAAPNGLQISGMVISWNPVEGAASYEVTVGDQVIAVDTNSLDLAQGGLTLSQGQIYRVKVKTVNANNEVSSFSEEIVAGYFAMDPNVTYHHNTVYWSGVLGASKYQVRVNGGSILNVSDATSAKVVLTQEGENLIEVRFVNGEEHSEWVSVTVTAFAVEYDTRSVAYGSFFVEYLAVGDEMSLPTTGFSYDGYEFSGWYNAPKGAAGNGKRYEQGAVFTGNAYTVVYAEWSPADFKVTLNTEGFDISNVENGQQETVTYTKEFALPVPEAKNVGMYIFAGWYTAPYGTGVQVTDHKGVCVAPYSFTQDLTLYPYYSTDAVKFIIQEDGTYGVYRGESIKGVTELEIPAFHNNIAVTKILESAFNHSDCNDLVSVRIPDTITLIGASAFSSCQSLESIEVYKGKEGTYETFYSSKDGVLIREDMGTTYLELVPRAKKGDFTIPDNVDRILTRAFYYSELSNITIPNNVIGIPKYAFYNCKQLKNVIFETKRTNDIEIGDYAFYMCDAIESMVLPANFNVELDALTAVLNMIENLKSITVEDGGTRYASVGGMLTDDSKSTILYCPKNYAGPVSIPNGITAVGDKAFAGRTKITAVTIPVWVSNIGASAFEGCTGLKQILFEGFRSDNLTIGASAFALCSGVTTITFEGNGGAGLDTGKVTIGEKAFFVNNSKTSDTSLTTVVIGEGVNIASVGKRAFAQQFKLREMNIAETVVIEEIGDYAFEKCKSLVTIDIPASVTDIGQYAFAQCESLAAVNFRTEGATSLEIANYAFQNCTKMGQILLPDHLTEFKSAAFEGCDALKAILVTETNPLYLNDKNGILYKRNDDQALTELLFYPKGLARDLGGVVNNLPDTLITIGGSAFSANKYLVSVTIPKTVTTIDVSAFANCENLTTVLFSDDCAGLTIGNNAFMNCVALHNIALPAATTSIGVSAFENCTFTGFTVPAGVKSISYAAFKNCAQLAELRFETTGNLTIGDAGSNVNGAFAGCVSLKNVNLPKRLITLGKYAFYHCTGLENVTFGTVTENGDGSYTTNSELTTIGQYAFNMCTGLKTIVIPKSVTTIGNSAFAMVKDNPGSLENVIFERFGTQELTIEPSAFAFQAKLTTITLPARTYKIDRIAVGYTSTNEMTYHKVFEENVSLAEINIDTDTATGVTRHFTSIDGVLYNGSMTAVLFCPAANVGRYVDGQPTYELVIPTSVKTIMTHAFQNITALKTVTFAEFEKGSANYGQPLLTIGNYVYSAANIVTVRNTYTGSKGYELSAFGGLTENSIATIHLPSHLAKINSGAFASKNVNPVDIVFNADIDQLELADFAFVHCRALSLEIPGTLKSIGENNFRENIHLQRASFNLPEGTTKLPDNLFHGCLSLESFPIPAQIEEIPQYAFYNCKALKHIELPQGLTKLGNACFSGAGLETVTIPTTVTSSGLGTNIFYNCDSLTTVVFAKAANGKSPMTWIGQSMFNSCDVLENINFEDMDLQVINNNAFTDCKKLKNVDFTKMPNLYYIGTMAFSRTALTHADLSKTVVSDIYNSFSNLATLETFVFPKNIKSVATNVFLNDTALKSVTLSENFTGAMLVKFNGLATDVIIPASNPNLVKDSFGVIYDHSYQSLYFVSGRVKNLTGYVMPSTVLTISDYAFTYAKGDVLVLPEGVKTIGQYAFCYANIPNITIASTVETIGQRAFQYSGVEQLIFANEHNSKLKSIGGYAFEGASLRSIVLPDNLDFVYTTQYIFYNCKNLKSITVGAKTKVVPQNFINGCSALEEIRFQEGLESIYCLNSFYSAIELGKTNLVTSITIPSTVKTLVDGAFGGFENLQTVIIPANSQLENIGISAFQNCFALQSIQLPASVTKLGKGAFRNCESLEAMDLTDTGITVIDENTFDGTKSMVTLCLPGNLLTIGKRAFYGTGAQELDIPASVTAIGDSAFENAAALKTITFAPDSMMETLGSEETNSRIFKGTTSLDMVILPNILQTIGNEVFAGSGVKEVKMTDSSVPSELRFVGNGAFADCVNMTSFNHLSKVSTIGEAAFMNCANLTSAPVGEELDYMGAMAFGFCDKLASVRIPASVTELGGNPFAGLHADKITLDSGNTFFSTKTENGVLSLYDAAQSIIYGVYGATGDYEIDKDATMLMAGALAGNAITKVELSDKLIVDTNYMFMNCTLLSDVTMNSVITSIGRYAFYKTAITAIEIPATVTSIGDYAFAYCTKLNNVTIPAAVSSFGNFCFAYCDTLSVFAFEESSAVKTMGTHFFYQCPNITEVILPTNFKITEDDALSNGQQAHNTQGAIPSYTFAGTGIVHAVLPKNVSYYYTAGVFAGCEKLEKITLMGNPSQAGALQLMPASWLEGCTNFKELYMETFSNAFAYPVEWAYKSGFKALRVGGVALGNVTAFNVNARFNYVDADFVLYVENCTYQELIEMMAGITNSWKLKIYDKDGNLLISSDSNGSVAQVRDANGNIIWDAATAG